MNFLRNCRDSLRWTMNSNRSSNSNSDRFSVSDDEENDTTQPYIRRAHHAGSWYSSDPDTLDDLLTKFLTDAEDDDKNGDNSSAPESASGIGGGVPNACISPHAGFQYSGATAAYSYLALGEAIQKNPLLRTVVVVSCVGISFTISKG